MLQSLLHEPAQDENEESPSHSPDFQDESQAGDRSVKVKPIVWKQGRSADYGYVGSVRLFVIGYNGFVPRDDPKKESKRYYLGTDLPGCTEKMYAGTQDELKRIASNVLNGFIKQITEEV